MDTQFQEHTDAEWASDMATDGGAVEGDYPLWSGEYFSGPTEDTFCPASVPRPHFRVQLVRNGEFVHFQSWATAIYMHDVPSPYLSYRSARYSMPPGVHSYSDDGRYEARGGTLYGGCAVYRFRVGTTTVIGGNMIWFKFDGEVWERDESGEGGGGRGWGYSDETGFQNGTGSGSESWQTVINRYLTTGECTEGWELWVDEIQVCAA